MNLERLTRLLWRWPENSAGVWRFSCWGLLDIEVIVWNWLLILNAIRRISHSNECQIWRKVWMLIWRLIRIVLQAASIDNVWRRVAWLNCGEKLRCCPTSTCTKDNLWLRCGLIGWNRSQGLTDRSCAGCNDSSYSTNLTTNFLRSITFLKS